MQAPDEYLRPDEEQMLVIVHVNEGLRLQGGVMSRWIPRSRSIARG
jgi:hypothetical protein